VKARPNMDLCGGCGAPLQQLEVLGVVVRRPCSLCGAKREASRIARLLADAARLVSEHSEVPSRFAGANIGDLSGAPRTAVDDFLARLPDVRALCSERLERGDAFDVRTAAARAVANTAGLAFVGPVGTGKTHALAALLIAAQGRFIAGRLVTISALLESLRATFGGRETEQQWLALYASVPLLGIDDLDKLRATEWSASALFSVVNRRYERELPILITSNASPDQLLARTFAATPDVGVAIVDRLVGMAPQWVRLAGRSRRRPLVASVRIA